MSNAHTLKTLLGPILQIGFVTADVRRSAAHWACTQGIGPWLVLDPFPVEGFRYRGVAQPIDLVIAVSFSGGTQLELIEERNDVPSLYRGVARPEAGAVLHHCCHFPEDYDASHAALGATGHELLQDGAGSRGRFAYFGHPDATSYYVEIAERTVPRMKGFAELRELCARWDGSAPLRDRL